jgi:hypothetical protein
MTRIKLYVTCKPAPSWQEGDNVIDGFTYYFWSSDVTGIDGHIGAGTFEVNYEPPKGFDPRAGAVAALEAEKKRVQAEFQNRITEIEAQINKFTALEFKA